MQANEEDTFSIQNCVAALTEPLPYGVGWSFFYPLDMRRKAAKELARLSHPSHSKKIRRRYYDPERTAGSVFLRRAIKDCEDLDGLITVLSTIKKIQQ